MIGLRQFYSLFNSMLPFLFDHICSLVLLLFSHCTFILFDARAPESMSLIVILEIWDDLAFSVRHYMHVSRKHVNTRISAAMRLPRTS